MTTISKSLNQTSQFSSSPVESVNRSAEHLREWLATTGLAYGCSARERFVRAHPALFGSSYQLTLRGYDCWRARAGVSDTLDAFSEYIAPRHQCWSTFAPALASSGACDVLSKSSLARLRVPQSSTSSPPTQASGFHTQ